MGQECQDGSGRVRTGTDRWSRTGTDRWSRTGVQGPGYTTLGTPSLYTTVMGVLQYGMAMEQKSAMGSRMDVRNSQKHPY